MRGLGFNDVIAIIVIWGGLVGMTFCFTYYTGDSIAPVFGLLPGYYLTKWIILKGRIK